MTAEGALPMKRIFLMSKLHNAKIIGSNFQKEGSFELDRELMEAADILVNEQLHVYNINTGAQFSTYVFPAPFGSRIVSINGASAHLVSPGDRVIISTYGHFDREEYKLFNPKILVLDEHNNFTIKERRRLIEQPTENLVT